MNIPYEQVAGIATLATAISAGIIRLIFLVKPIIADKRNQAAFLEVSRLGTMGASAAVWSYLQALEAARSPSSEGGKTVTPGEQKLALKAGVDAAWGALKRQAPGTIKNVLKYYGGEEETKKAMEVIVRRQAFGERLDQQLGDEP